LKQFRASLSERLSDDFRGSDAAASLKLQGGLLDFRQQVDFRGSDAAASLKRSDSSAASACVSRISAAAMPRPH